jgi:hypothetical protein
MIAKDRDLGTLYVESVLLEQQLPPPPAEIKLSPQQQQAPPAGGAEKVIANTVKWFPDALNKAGVALTAEIVDTLAQQLKSQIKQVPQQTQPAVPHPAL